MHPYGLRAAALRHLLLVAGIAAPLSATPAGAQVLNVAIGAPITSMDPHFYNAGPNNGMAMHVFRFLTTRDAQAQVRPDLAEHWQVAGDTTWEFRLREGLVWQDGRPLVADDVVFSLARAPNVPNSPGGFGGMVSGIRSAEALDARTVRITTGGPFPLLPNNLAAVAIIARHAAEGASTADFNSLKAAIGAGPYRVVSFTNGDRVVLERSDSYLGDKPHWQRVNYRMILNDGARVAALRAGDVDIIDQVPGTDLPRMMQDAAVSIVQIQGLRVVYIAFDFASPTGPAGVSDAQGRPLAANPFRDVRVRRALSIGILRQAIADRVMSGTAMPTGQWLPPGTFGYNPDVVAPRLDVEGAKRLLAEALPQGLKLTLHTPNDRWANDAQTAQAIAQYWTRLGVITQVEAQPWAAFSTRSARNEFPVRMASWGSTPGEASYTLVNVIGTYSREKRWGSVNAGRYSNPALDALTDRALATIDDAKREAILREAVKLAMDDVAIIPVHQLMNFWAMRRGLTYEPRMDERTLAFRVAPSN